MPDLREEIRVALLRDLRAFIADIKGELRQKFNQNIEASCNGMEITMRAFEKAHESASPSPEGPGETK